jgi:adenylate cyclase
MDRVLKSAIDDWIVGATLAGSDERAILTGVAERLADAGFPVLRAAVAGNLLDPTHRALVVLWNRGSGGSEESIVRRADGEVNEGWSQSPFAALLESADPMLRRRLDGTYRRGEFPLLDEFAEAGVTDYVAYVARIDENLRLGDRSGLLSSWTTDAADGFTDDQVALLAEVMRTYALAFMLQTTRRAAQTLITTYMGSDAAERVLAGNIVRGRAEPIRAVVWFSDLVGFTRMSEAIASAGVLALLNEYAEVQVDSIEEHGGHVLKFIGDGILAIFRDEDAGVACVRALDAAASQRRRIVALNERRRVAGLPVTDTRLALHVGELLYGNVGSPRRLDFTVLGPAVNEAARIEALCGSLEQTVIVSSAFAEAAGAARSRLVSLGRYALKGVQQPQELFTLDPHSLEPPHPLA